MEVVYPRDGGPVTLRPCPSWCTRGRHFAGGDAIYADDGYHHWGPPIAVPTAGRALGMKDGPEIVVKISLKSWTHPLDAPPGPALVEVQLGTAEEDTDLYAELAPDQARAVAAALLELAAAAERPDRTGRER